METLRVLPEPLVGECVLCFLARAVGEHGCDGALRWVARFRETTAPDATGLEGRVARRGEPCDGRVLADGWQLTREACVRDVHTDELLVPEPMPWCQGVRPGSSRPCGLWELRRRGERGVVVGLHGGGCRWPPEWADARLVDEAVDGVVRAAVDGARGGPGGAVVGPGSAVGATGPSA